MKYRALEKMKGLALDLRYHPDHNMTTRVGLRLWIDCASASKPGAMEWFGTRCSSFVGLSRRHHKRSVSNGYWGDQGLKFVREGNIMIVPDSVAG